MRIAVVGATGMVGEVMLKVLAERNFPVAELIPVASERSVWKEIEFKGKKYKVVGMQTAVDMKEHIDIDVSKILQRKMNLDQAGDILIDSTIKTANGRLTCAEALGHREFVITKLYRSA